MKKLIFLLSLLPYAAWTQPSFNMTLLSNLDLPNLPSRYGAEYSDCWGYHAPNGTEIAVIGGIEDIFFVDVTSPANPVVIYTHHVLNLPQNTTNQSLWREFKTYSHYLYAVSDEGTAGLLIFDLSQVPNSVTLANQTVAFWTRTHMPFIDEAHARFYAAGSNTVSNGLVILDLTDPINPTLLANLPLNGFGGGYVHDLYVRDNIAYCSHGNLQKLSIYDLNDLPNVTVLGSIENYPGAGYNHSSWLNAAGNMLVMCDETHGSAVKLIDVSDPSNISSDDIHTFYSELLGSNAPGSSIAHNPYILGDLCYLSYYHDGVQVFDISNPTNITNYGYYDTYPDNTDYNGYVGCWGCYPFLPSGTILGSDMNNGLFMLQLGNNPLDIEFLAFDASRQGPDVRLNWTIADASFGNRFEIQRSIDKGTTWSKLGEVKLVDAATHYTFYDKTIQDGRQYLYRIDFMQLDGKRISSPLRHIVTISKETAISVANPIDQALILNLTKAMPSLDLKLYDFEGKLVWSQSLDQPVAQMQFDVSQLGPGQYVLTMNWPEGSENLLVQKVN